MLKDDRRLRVTASVRDFPIDLDGWVQAMKSTDEQVAAIPAGTCLEPDGKTLIFITSR